MVSRRLVREVRLEIDAPEEEGLVYEEVEATA